jgi:hypothetical protein
VNRRDPDLSAHAASDLPERVADGVRYKAKVEPGRRCVRNGLSGQRNREQ